MSHKINVEVDIEDEKKSKELMTKAVSDIIRMRIEELPKQLQIKAYDIILKEIETYK